MGWGADEFKWGACELRGKGADGLSWDADGFRKGVQMG